VTRSKKIDRDEQEAKGLDALMKDQAISKQLRSDKMNRQVEELKESQAARAEVRSSEE
jgi:hypothetical protein